MSLELQEHQKQAYENVKELFDKGRYAAVIFPTGCGKSFVSLKLMEENKDKKILYLSPSNPIKNQMCKYIIENLGKNKEINNNESLEKQAKEILPGFESLLYQTLLSEKDKTKEIIENLNPDLIILDEVHHIKTKTDNEDEIEEQIEENKWGEKVKELLEMYPKAKVLGITATPERTDKINVVEKIFEGHIALEITLLQALMNEKIEIKPPKYVPADYALADDLENIVEQIEKTTDANQKKKLTKIYEKMRKIIQEADGISDIFKNNITKRDGKYIVFCKDREDMEEKMSMAKEWFKGIDDNPEIYAVASAYESERGKDYNIKQIQQFENSKSRHIKLLYSISMLDEGIHVDNVSGVIMTKRTNSRILYLQQLGRALSTDPDKEQPIVFDLVNNYITYNLYNEGQEILEKSIHKNKTNKNEAEKKEKIADVLEAFKIKGKAKDFIELLSGIKEELDKTAISKLIETIEILRKNGVDTKKLPCRPKLLKEVNQKGIDIEKIIKEYCLDGNYNIGTTIRDAKTTLKGKSNYKITEEEKEKLIEYEIISKEEIEKAKKEMEEGQEKKKSSVAKLLEIIEILKKNGIETSKLPHKSKLLKDIKQDKIDIKAIIEEYNLDSEYNIGTRIASAIYAAKGKGTIKITEEEKEKLIKYEIISEEEIQKSKRGDKKESKEEKAIRYVRILSENGVDLNLINCGKQVKGIRIYDKLDDIKQKEVDINILIKENNLDKSYGIGNAIKNIKTSLRDRKGIYNFTEEQLEELSKMGLNTEIETAEERFIKCIEALTDKGIKIESIMAGKKIDNKKIYDKIRDIKQEGIDIEKIIKENNLDGEFSIGSALSNTKISLRGGKTNYNYSPEQVEKLINLKVITREEIEKSKQLIDIKKKRDIIKSENDKIRKLEEKVTKEYEKEKGKIRDGK